MNEETLFHLALEKPAAERAAFLDRACGGDTTLRQRLDALLLAHANPGSFLQGPAVKAMADSDLPDTVRPGLGPGRLCEGPGSRVGPYRLLQQIGEGGMGVVFLAEQAEPVRRQVALKVVKPGMDSAQVIARFEAERQALALMDHPHIAKVFDAGTTDSGRPYFVMELVRGAPVTEFCDGRRLTPRQRLELFVPVCQAVQHAHQKGIIHRDLKPSNVLVALHDGRPVPKVIDFGVAKATGRKLTERTLFTEVGAVVGTLEYMSPEQAELGQLDIDTRSDIYSLGVLLYDLLTGTTPLERKRLQGAALLEALRLIREEDPPRPSARLNSTAELPAIAVNRGLEPRKLAGVVRGELDWIAMRCLEKDRERRYETAGALAQDVARYLADEPVQACPPGLSYRLRKFARRHRRALVTAALLAAALLAALGAVAGSLGWAARDRAGRQAALEREADRALEEVAGAHQGERRGEAWAALKRAEGLLASGQGGEAQARRAGRWRTDLEMADLLDKIRLDQAEVKDGAFNLAGADPAYEKAFREYGLDLVALDPAAATGRVGASAVKKQLLAGLDDWLLAARAARGPSGPDRLLAVLRLADPDRRRNQIRETVRGQGEPALEALARDKEPLPPASALLLARVLRKEKKHALAVGVLRQAQQQHPAGFWLNHDLAYLFMRMEPPQLAEAVGYYRAAVALRPESPGVRLNLAIALSKQDRYAEAEAALRAAVGLDPKYAEARSELGYVLFKQGRRAEAGEEARTALLSKPGDANAHLILGWALVEQGKPAEAVGHFEKAVLRWSAEAIHFKKDTDRAVVEGYFGLGLAYARTGQWRKAEAAFTAGLKRSLQEPWCWFWCGALRLHNGDPAGHRRACRLMVERFGDTRDPQVAYVVAKTCLLVPDGAGVLPKAVILAGQATRGTKKDISYGSYLLTLALANYRFGFYDMTVKGVKRVSFRGSDAGATTAAALLAMAYHRLGKAEEARAALARARALLTQKVPDPARGRPFGQDWYEWLCGRILFREAEALLREG
jgi:eukaryotic-like serine/threonine-protein kinase